MTHVCIVEASAAPFSGMFGIGADEGAAVQAVDKGQVLFEPGAPADRLYGVVSGQVALIAGDGRVMDLLGPGAVFGEEALVGGIAMFSAKALRPGRIEMLDPARVPSLDGSLERLTRFVLAQVVERQMRLVRDFAASRKVPPLQRLARLILDIPETRAGLGRARLPWPKRVIAEWIGVRPETFSRMLPGLLDHGARIEGCWVEIADYDRFLSFAGGASGQWHTRACPSGGMTYSS